MLESRLCRLFVSRLQHEHGILSDRFSGFVEMGQGSDDGAGSHFICNGSVARSAGREYPLVSVMEKQRKAPSVIHDRDSNDDENKRRDPMSVAIAGQPTSRELKDVT